MTFGFLNLIGWLTDLVFAGHLVAGEYPGAQTGESEKEKFHGLKREMMDSIRASLACHSASFRRRKDSFETSNLR